MTRTIASAANAWFRAVEQERLTVSWLDPLAARAGRKLAVAGIWLFALTVAYPYVPGAESEAFKGVSVFVGLVVSLGSAGVVGQILSRCHSHGRSRTARTVPMGRVFRQAVLRVKHGRTRSSSSAATWSPRRSQESRSRPRSWRSRLSDLGAIVSPGARKTASSTNVGWDRPCFNS